MNASEPERVLRERLEEIQARIATLAKTPEPGSGIGFGKRVGDGTSCGEPIAPARLEVAPESVLCIGCAR